MSDEPPAPATSSYAPPRNPTDGRQYRLGLAAGVIPVVFAWVWLGASTHGAVALSTVFGVLTSVSAALLLIAAIVCLVMRSRRWLGYGLLTMVFVGPVVWCIGCIVILSAGGTG